MLIRRIFSNFCCTEEKVEVDMQLELIRVSDESILNEAQRDFDLHSLSPEEKDETLYLNETYLYQLKIYIELNKGFIQARNDFLYIIPEKAPVPEFFNRIKRDYYIPLAQKHASNSVGFAEFSLKNLSLNEPYIIYYLRRDDSTLGLTNIFSSKIFKLFCKSNNNAFVSKIRNMELSLVYEDDPDFFKQNVESTKIISAWNTPHRKIESLKGCSSTSIKKIDSSETNNEFSSTKQKATPYLFAQNPHFSNQISEFRANEEKDYKDSKIHQRNFSIFTASKSTCSSLGESYLGGILENKLTKNKNLLRKNLFDNKTSAHHKTLSMNTPNIKTVTGESNNSEKEKTEKALKSHYLSKGSIYDRQLFSYKAMKNGSKGNCRTLLSFDENQLKKVPKEPTLAEKNRNSALKSLFQTRKNSTEFKKESPDQSFFLNVNEMSYTEIHPNNKVEKLNMIHGEITKTPIPKAQASGKFINLHMEPKVKPKETIGSKSNIQTPQSMKRLYTVEEVFSISNDSSSLNDTHCFKFPNSNSAKKNNMAGASRTKEDKIKNIINVDVVEEDEEISLNHITANETLDDRIFYEQTFILEENNQHLPKFLRNLENKLHLMKILESYGAKFKEIGFSFRLNFKSNVMIIYQSKSLQMYQLYRFIEFKNMNDVNSFMEDIYASVKFSTL